MRQSAPRHPAAGVAPASDAASVPSRAQLPEIVVTIADAHGWLVDQALPGFLTGLYLHGSIGFGGEFHAGSDIDFVATCSRRTSDEDNEALRRVHAEVARRWATPPYDGFYLLESDLAGRPEDVPDGPGILHDWFTIGRHADLTPITWHELREHGVTLRGTALTDLGIYADAAGLQTATRASLDTYWRRQLEAMEHHPRESGLSQAAEWGGLGPPRLLHLLRTGRATSKSGAGRWALEVFPQHRDIVEEALRVRERPDEPSPYAAEPDRRRRDLIAFMTDVIDDGGHRGRAAEVMSEEAGLPVSVGRGDVTSATSRALLRDYLVDVSDRWDQLHHSRNSTPEEIEQGWTDMRSDDLAPPTGAFVVASRGDVLVGCAGVRMVPGEVGVAELKRMFVRPHVREAGVGGRLLAAAEAAARQLGASVVRLDTRLDLLEARALYVRAGYAEVPAFTDGPYAEVWYAKQLARGKPRMGQ